jgi:hypothetical protein
MLDVVSAKSDVPAPRSPCQEGDMMLSKILSSAALLGTSLWAPSAWSVDPPGSKPGDDALTCEQVYAQGADETQREQQKRAAKNEQLRHQRDVTGALVAGAMLTGGLGGTGPAAQKAAEAQAATQMAMLTPPPPNLRKERLKQLWTQKRCEKRPLDDDLTCEQLATELSAYVQQMQPGAQALAISQQQQATQALSTLDRRRTEHQLLAPLATAGALDPTGASKRAYVAALGAQAAKEHAEDEAAKNSPLAQQATSQSQQLAAQGQAMQADARMQHLMRLAQQKGCTRK